MSDIRGYTHVSLSVSNLDRSSSFYSKVLGLPVLVEVLEGTAFDGREQIFRVGRSALCLQEHRDNLGSDFEPSRTGLDHLSLEVPTIESLHAWGERLTATGVEHSGVKRCMDSVTSSSFAIRTEYNSSSTAWGGRPTTSRT
jgi:glyoxylase I family protein